MDEWAKQRKAVADLAELQVPFHMCAWAWHLPAFQATIVQPMEPAKAKEELAWLPAEFPLPPGLTIQAMDEVTPFSTTYQDVDAETLASMVSVCVSAKGSGSSLWGASLAQGA